MITVSRDRDNFQLKYVSAETTLKESEKQVKEIEQLNKQLSETKNKNELLQHEIDALKVRRFVSFALYYGVSFSRSYILYGSILYQNLSPN